MGHNNHHIGGFVALAVMLVSVTMTFMPGVALATVYYACSGDDPVDTSSFTGLTKGSTYPAGWSTTPGGSRSVNGMVDGNDYYILSNVTKNIRTPPTTFATPANSTLTVLGGAEFQVGMKLGHDQNMTLNNCTVECGSKIVFSASNGAVQDFNNIIAGSIYLAEGSLLRLTGRHSVASDNYEYNNHYDLSAAVTGAGAIECVNWSLATDKSYSELTTKISGDLSGFVGDIVNCGSSSFTSPQNLELVNTNSIPADPPAGETAYVVVTNGATLVVDQDWTSGRNRVWEFGSGRRPTIYVAAGKTVTIKGEVRGSVGFIKSGAGTLVLRRGGLLSGACVVLSGKVRLEGEAAALSSLFRPKKAISLPSGYTMLDYIRLSGGNANSYVDTGYTPTATSFGYLLDFYIDRDIVVLASANHRIMGTVQGSGSNSWKGIFMTCRAPEAGTTGQITCGSRKDGLINQFFPPTATGFQAYTRLRATMIDNIYYISRGWMMELNTAAIYPGGSLYLGATNVKDQALSAGAPQRIYRFQIFDGYTLLHDFVPVQASDGKLGLYDTFGDKGFRQVVDQTCATSGGAYSGSDSKWLEVERGPGSVYYLR